MDKRRLIKRLVGKIVSVYEDYRRLTSGVLEIDNEQRVYVNGNQIPRCSMRSVGSWGHNGVAAIIFVDPAYRLREAFG